MPSAAQPQNVDRSGASAALTALQARLAAVRAAIGALTAAHAPGADVEGDARAVLAAVMGAKMCDMAMHGLVESALERLGVDQLRLRAARLAVENLAYEKDMLGREIQACRASAGGIDAHSDEEHTTVLERLRVEVEERKALRIKVEDVCKAREERKRLNLEEERFLAALPRQIATVSANATPLRNFFRLDGGAEKVEAQACQRLPPPLFVLAREAMAFRDAFPGRLAVSVSNEEPTSASAAESTAGALSPLTDLHEAHPSCLVIEVRGEPGTPSEKCALLLTFRFHHKLGFVSVSARFESGATQVEPLSAADLRALYPLDYGDESPNAANVHLLDGQFAFDSTLAHGGLPFLWANLLCGLHFPMTGCEHGRKSRLPEQFLSWTTAAAQYPSHLRFKEVCSALRDRLTSVLSLRQQLAQLQSTHKVPVSWDAAGISHAPHAQLDDFVTLKSEEHALTGSLGNGKHIKLWGFRVSGKNVRMTGMIELQPDYPTRAGVFHLKPDSRGHVSEASLRRLELELNVFEASGVRADLILSAQLVKLLSCIDALEANSEGTIGVPPAYAESQKPPAKTAPRRVGRQTRSRSKK